MSETVRWSSGQPRRQESRGDGANLADILERVLDKGIVIAGDIQVNLLDIELLTIKVRLVVASVDRAKEMGIDWWERDPTLSSGRRDLEDENARLRERIEALERGGRADLPGPDDDPDDPDIEATDDEDPDAEDPDGPDVEDPVDEDQDIGDQLPDDPGPDDPDPDEPEPDREPRRAPPRRRSASEGAHRNGTSGRRRTSRDPGRSRER